MKSLKDSKCLKPIMINSKVFFFIKLQKSLYGLKQFDRMWYNCLNEYMLEKEFENNEICSCIFIKKTTSKFAIIVVYVNDLNLIGTHEELIKIVTYLKNEFEMKNLGIFFLSWFTN